MPINGDPLNTTPLNAGRRRVKIYEVQAADTPEGQERLRAYYEALGRFASGFAETEAAVQRVLRFYAQTSIEVARSIFSGTRIRSAKSFIFRICEATNVDEAVRESLKELFDRLGVINDVRDHIFHYGATDIAEGDGKVSNELVAHASRTVFIFPISPEILDDMRADLKKIRAHLLIEHVGAPPDRVAVHRHASRELFEAPWRYKKRQLPAPDPRKPGVSRVVVKPLQRLQITEE